MVVKILNAYVRVYSRAVKGLILRYSAAICGGNDYRIGGVELFEAGGTTRCPSRRQYAVRPRHAPVFDCSSGVRSILLLRRKISMGRKPEEVAGLVSEQS